MSADKKPWRWMEDTPFGLKTVLLTRALTRNSMLVQMIPDSRQPRLRPCSWMVASLGEGASLGDRWTFSPSSPAGITSLAFVIFLDSEEKLEANPTLVSSQFLISVTHLMWGFRLWWCLLGRTSTEPSKWKSLMTKTSAMVTLTVDTLFNWHTLGPVHFLSGD